MRKQNTVNWAIELFYEKLRPFDIWSSLTFEIWNY